MKGIYYALIAAALAVAVAVVVALPKSGTVEATTVTVDSGKSTTVVVVAPCSGATPTAPASSTAPGASSGWKLPPWLGTPFARYTLYVIASAGAVLLLTWVKRRFLWEGKRMLQATIVVVAAFGMLLTYLFQDKGASILSNPLNIGGGIGLVYMLANLAFQMWVKKL